MRSHLGKTLACFVGASTLFSVAPVSHADNIGFNDVLSTPTIHSFDNIDINSFLGANTFYNAGYTGAGTIVSNIEAGYVWNQQETLTGTLLLGTAPGVTGQVDQHATWVGQAIAGNGTQTNQRGIAYGATLWSGAIATYWNPPATTGGYSLSFHYNAASFLAPYLTSMVTGVTSGGITQTADVINSSWSNSNTDGSSPYTETIDALINTTHKIVVASVGNNTATNSQVTGIAAGYNSIAVGATSSDLNYSTYLRYTQPAYFTNAGPNDYSGPDAVIPADENNYIGRAPVDLLAPGTNLTLATYGGTTGGNFLSTTDPTHGATNLYTPNLQGTSFSSALVAGGAGLLVDAGKSQFGGGNAIDNRVIKAVLMASADQGFGWTNGLNDYGTLQNSLGNDVLTTNQGVDFTQGAGQMDLTTAYGVYLGGTTGIAGGKGGFAGSTGWDLGTVGTDIADGLNFNSYYLGELYANSTFTSVLTWNVDDAIQTDANGNPLMDANGDPVAAQLEFAQLDLLLFEMINGTWVEIAESDSYLNNTIELSLNLTDDANYMFEVLYTGERYNTTGIPTSAVNYGVAWNAVPEPNSCVLGVTTGLFTLTFALRRRRK